MSDEEDSRGDSSQSQDVGLVDDDVEECEICTASDDTRSSTEGSAPSSQEESLASAEKKSTRESYATGKSKRDLKLIRHFAYALLNRAEEDSWEAEEQAKLLALIVREMGMTGEQITRFIIKSEIGTVESLSVLMDLGIDFSIEQKLAILVGKKCSSFSFVEQIGQAVDAGILSLSDVETITAVSQSQSKHCLL